MSNITITGYLRGGECAHCGRELKHVVCTDGGQFGAACFANKITQPKIYMGKKLRLGTDSIISLARMARDPSRNGISSWHLTFEAA